MSRKFKIISDYYDNGEKLYKKRSIEINPGVSVLVGCNGIGKSTLIRQIENQLSKDKIPCIKFDNLNDGGHNAREKAGFFEDFSFLVTSACSSEGENIVMNMVTLAKRLGNFVRTGEDNDKLEKMFNNLSKIITNKDEEEKSEIPKERWIFLDAVDSGLSIDNIIDIKENLFKTMLKHDYDNEIYIIVSANSYEMARDENCFDVYNGEYIKFKNYEAYRTFVLLSKEWKDRRQKR